MVSFTAILTTALLMSTMASAATFVGPQTRARSLESRLFSAVPISPGDALVGALDTEGKEVKKKAPVAVKKEEKKESSLSGTFLTGVLGFNAALLACLVTFATLGPTPVVEDNTPPQTPAQIERNTQLKNQKLAEENLAAEQVSYINGADFFFY